MVGRAAVQAMSDADQTCGMSIAIDVVGGKWKMHLMWVLAEGPVRFGQIRRKLDGVSEKVLAENLRQLEAHGIVHRELYAEVPPRVEYSLTPLGEQLNQALRPLEVWGDANREALAPRLVESPAC
jgi:DNA-binding HxlR family transcriptional regulator